MRSEGIERSVNAELQRRNIPSTTPPPDKARHQARATSRRWR
jgi:hypothetical protein